MLPDHSEITQSRTAAPPSSSLFPQHGLALKRIHWTVQCNTLSTLVFSAVYSIVFSTVYTILLVTIYRKQGRGFSLGNSLFHPATLTPGYSLLYILVYTLTVLGKRSDIRSNIPLCLKELLRELLQVLCGGNK